MVLNLTIFLYIVFGAAAVLTAVTLAPSSVWHWENHDQCNRQQDCNSVKQEPRSGFQPHSCHLLAMKFGACDLMYPHLCLLTYKIELKEGQLFVLW